MSHFANSRPFRHGDFFEELPLTGENVEPESSDR